MTIRNTAAHGVTEFGEQLALERLAALSLLARWPDDCNLVEASGSGSPTAAAQPQ